MGDMIKAVKKNFDLKSGLSSRLSFCPVFNCFGQNSSIFKTMMEMGNSKIISPNYLRIVELLDSR